ncbi:MAG: hypothetical protein KDD94_00685 [Calditrichaeota bacterium]|nr:hypothetical protein [Calditrichota bacterium]
MKQFMICMIMCWFFACDQLPKISDPKGSISIKIPRGIPNKIFFKDSTVLVYSVKMVIDSVQFYTENGDSIQLFYGPELVSLDSATNFIKAAEFKIPEGTYSHASFLVRPPTPSEMITDTAFFERTPPSMVITGRSDTLNFYQKVGGRLLLKQQLIDPLTVIAGSVTNITFFLDTRLWFPDGYLPYGIKETGKLEKDILNSLDVFADNNGDGVMD